MNTSPTLYQLISSVKVGMKHKVGHGKCRYSKFILEVIKKLQNKYIIEEYKIDYHKKQKYVFFTLKTIDKLYLFQNIKAVSLPGKRISARCNKLIKYKSGYTNMFVTTNRGILDFQECKKHGLGGEIILVYQ